MHLSWKATQPLRLLAVVVSVGVVHVGAASGQGLDGGAAPSVAQSVVDESCVGCHNDRLRRGELTLAGLDVTRPDSSNPIWEKVIRKVRTGMMPPPGVRRPDPASLESLAATLEAALDGASAAHPDPGRPALHRLNRTEYRNVVRDLLNIDIDVTKLLPPDDMTRGFDNIADVLTISPTLMDSYVRAAGTLSRLAVGDAALAPATEVYKVPQMLSQLDHVEGTPMGTRGGIAVRHFFPADGEYTFGLTLYGENGGQLFGTRQRDEQIEVAVDGDRVALLDIDPAMLIMDELRTKPIKVAAGPRMLSASFIRRAHGPAVDLVMRFETTLINIAAEGPGVVVFPHLSTLGVTGPSNITGLGDTPSRRKILTCRPVNPKSEEPCARKILSTLARQAYRTSVGTDRYQCVDEALSARS